jgi:hypothetical protein
MRGSSQRQPPNLEEQPRIIPVTTPETKANAALSATITLMRAIMLLQLHARIIDSDELSTICEEQDDRLEEHQAYASGVFSSEQTGLICLRKSPA